MVNTATGPEAQAKGLPLPRALELLVCLCGLGLLGFAIIVSALWTDSVRTPANSFFGARIAALVIASALILRA
jgi:hypothetical protein